jgi:arsenate reductase
MVEDGIDISTQTSDTIDKYMGIDFDYVITVCDNAKESCRIFLQKQSCFIKTFRTLQSLSEQKKK